ncbi:MAG: hypothetical protein EOM15_06725 [Spirochaetia bacterium]|nr:hypothetical protein [Spirochaetia bacterium]
MMRRKRHAKLHTLLFLFIMLMIVLIIVTLGNLSFYLYEREIIQGFAKNRQDTLLQISDSVNSYRERIENLASLYRENAYIQEQAALESPFVEQEAFNKTIDELKTLIDQSLFFPNLSYDLQILFDNGLFYASNKAHLETLLNLPKKTWFYQARRKQHDAFWQTNIAYKTEDGKKNVVSFVTLLRDEEQQSIGFILVNVDERDFYHIYSRIIGDQSIIYLIDHQGQIVSHPIDTMIGRFFYQMEKFNSFFGNQNYSQIQKSGKEYLFSRYLSPGSPWIVVEEIPMALLTDPLKRTANTINLLTTLLLVFTLVCTIIFSRMISRPFEVLAGSMNSAQKGTMEVQFKQMGCYESRNMAVNSQKFVQRINALLGELKQKEKAKRISELDFLQMQINPHFIYNTLFTIRCMVDMNLTREASDTIQRFSNMLKKILRIEEPMISIQDNLDYLEDYNSIMSQRYGSLSFTYEIEEGLQQVKILKFILQPLVENSIYHGFANGVDKDSRIGISFKRAAQDCVKITVEDNGCGFPEEKLQTHDSEKQHIGLLNVQKKLELYYEGKASMHIHSIKNIGTKIEILVPIQQGKTDENTHS